MEVALSQMEVVPSKMEVTSSKIEVSPFFCRFSRFTHFCRDLHFVAIYALFPPIFLAKIANPATKVLFLMYGYEYSFERSVRNQLRKVKNNELYIFYVLSELNFDANFHDFSIFLL